MLQPQTRASKAQLHELLSNLSAAFQKEQRALVSRASLVTNDSDYEEDDDAPEDLDLQPRGLRRKRGMKFGWRATCRPKLKLFQLRAVHGAVSPNHFVFKF